MKLKRANAAIALLVLLALCVHAAVECWSMWTGWYEAKVVEVLGIIVASLLVVHVILVLCIFFFIGNHEIVDYRKEPRATIIQRVTAILTLFFIHFHFFAFAAVSTDASMAGMEKFWLCVTQVAFLACVMAHIAVSVGEAFFTVKWVHTPAAVHRIDKVMYVICAIVFLVSASGAIRFFILY